MTNEIVTTELAPLESLIDILPIIETAKQRARLGSALDKATKTIGQFSRYPELLNSLSTLAKASGPGLKASRSDIQQTLRVIIAMARRLAGQLTLEELDNLNQGGLSQLPLQIEKIEERVEAAWREAVQNALGRYASLGEVLINIPIMAALGRELTELAARASKLIDKTKPAKWRVEERDALIDQASALNDRLVAAGVALPIAGFLVAVAAGPVRLSELTDDIYSWISDNDALALFTVSARGS